MTQLLDDIDAIYEYHSPRHFVIGLSTLWRFDWLPKKEHSWFHRTDVELKMRNMQ